MVPQELQTTTVIRPEILPPRNTRASITLAKPFPRAGPIPIVPDHIQVVEELARLFRLPSLEVPIHVCLRAKVPQIHAQPSEVRGAVLHATETARIRSFSPATIHSCETTSRNERMLAALNTYVCYWFFKERTEDKRHKLQR